MEVTNILEVCKYHRFLSDGRLFETQHILAENIFSQISWIAPNRRHHGCHHQHCAKVTRRGCGAHWACRGGATSSSSSILCTRGCGWALGMQGREKVHFSPKIRSTQEQTSCSCEYLIILILDSITILTYITILNLINITILTLPLRAVGSPSPASLMGPKKFFRVSSRS